MAQGKGLYGGKEAGIALGDSRRASMGRILRDLEVSLRILPLGKNRFGAVPLGAGLAGHGQNGSNNRNDVLGSHDFPLQGSKQRRIDA